MRTTMRKNRRKHERDLTIREIKLAICSHEQIEPVAPPEHRPEWGGWRTKLTCPTCGFWYIHELPDASCPVPAAEAGEPVAALAHA
jgi:rubrerythrin